MEFHDIIKSNQETKDDMGKFGSKFLCPNFITFSLSFVDP
jgi:hypothetical protein